jgi:hypothetical protein
MCGCTNVCTAFLSVWRGKRSSARCPRIPWSTCLPTLFLQVHQVAPRPKPKDLNFKSTDCWSSATTVHFDRHPYIYIYIYTYIYMISPVSPPLISKVPPHEAPPPPSIFGYKATPMPPRFAAASPTASPALPKAPPSLIYRAAPALDNGTELDTGNAKTKKMYICIYVCIHMCYMCVYMFIYTCVCVGVRASVRVRVRERSRVRARAAHVTYACLFACLSVRVDTHIHEHTNTR